MTTIDPYTKIHKALRRDMFACLTTLGSLDTSDASAVERARAQVTTLLRDLHSHGEHEDHFLGPVLFEYLPEHAARLAEQHRSLDRGLEALAQRFADEAFSGPEALLAGYRELAAYTAAYLEHLAAEERALPDLAGSEPQVALMAAMAAFGASRSPAEREYSLRQMLPALAHGERLEFLRGFLAAPEPVASAARSIARDVLGDRAWSVIDRELIASAP
jgi:hypothetical protein